MKSLIKLVVPLIIVFFLLLSPLNVFAQNRSQREVFVPQDQVIKGDYFNAGSRVIIDGTVNGDAYVAGGEVEVNGVINGDLIFAGGQTTVRGKVTGNVRGAGGTILILGDIGKNVSIFGGNLTLDKNAKLSGNAVLAGGNIEVLTPVKNLTTAGGSVRIASNVRGDVRAAVGNLEAEGSEILGNLEYWSKNKANLNGSTVAGKTTFHESEAPEKLNRSAAKAVGVFAGIFAFLKIISFLSALLIGLLLIYLLPLYSERAADMVVSKFWQNLLVGFVGLIMTPIISVILMVTLIGFPLGIVLLMAYGIVIYLSTIIVALAAGKWIGTQMKWKLNMPIAYVLGLIIYEIVGIIPILGGFMKLVVLLLGIGVIILQKQYYYQILRDKKIL